MGTQTSVLVRVQARGGKFLGPNVEYSQVTVLNGGKPIWGPTVAKGDSGTVDARTGVPIPDGASRDVIVVQKTDGGPPPGAYWLTSDSGGTAGVTATFDLDAPSLLEFQATALYGTANPVTASVQMWVVPGMKLIDEPGVLLSIPGLAVSVTAQVAATWGGSVDVTGTVTMMCGCPITTPTWPEPQGGPEPYWPEPEFQAYAVLVPADGGLTSTFPMTFQSENTFFVSFPLPAKGRYTVGVYAVQQAESNVGYGTTTLTI